MNALQLCNIPSWSTVTSEDFDSQESKKLRPINSVCQFTEPIRRNEANPEEPIALQLWPFISYNWL